jgi:hypothetical protein
LLLQLQTSNLQPTTTTTTTTTNLITTTNNTRTTHGIAEEQITEQR